MFLSPTLLVFSNHLFFSHHAPPPLPSPPQLPSGSLASTGFHETVVAGSKLLRTITSSLLPRLQEVLTRETTPPLRRSNKMSVTYEQDQVALQVHSLVPTSSLSYH